LDISTDILKLLQENVALKAENVALKAENAAFKAENAAFKAGNIALKEQISALTKRVLELEKIIENLKIKKDSHNSSLPPSKEIVKRNQSLRQKSSKKRGGQPGHEGHSLKMTDTPDEIIKLESGFCTRCGADLSQVSSNLDARRQVIEIPPIQPVYIEYQTMSKVCNCGHTQTAAFPPNVTNHIQYGASVQAVPAYESVRQYMPFARLSETMSGIFNLRMSVGTIRNILHSMAEKARPIYEGIRQRVEKSTVIGGDESGVNVGGKNWWAWVFQTQFATFIAILATRGKSAVNELFSAGFANAIVVSDRWRAQLSTFAKGHQLCMAHLLRDLNYLIELEKTSWAKSIKQVFLRAIDLKKRLTDFNTDNPEVKQIEDELDLLLIQELTQEQTPKTLVFQNALKKHRDYLFPFLYYQDVPPDNNASERAVRNIKVKQKISGQFNGGHTDFAILRSVIDTVIKNSGDILDALKQIANLEIIPDFEGTE